MLQAADPGVDGRDLVAQPEADVGRDLVVTGAAGVKLLPSDADIGGERRLDVHVHVFELDAPVELAAVDALANAGQPRDDGVALLGGEDALAGEHPGVGHRACDVVAVQSAVEVDRAGEGLDERVGGLAEAAGPGFLIGHRSRRAAGRGSRRDYTGGP